MTMLDFTSLGCAALGIRKTKFPMTITGKI